MNIDEATHILLLIGTSFASLTLITHGLDYFGAVHQSHVDANEGGTKQHRETV